MFTMVILLLIGYFIYNFATGIIEQIQSGAPLELVHWIMFVMCLLFIPIGIIMIKRLFKENKEKKEKRAEEELKFQEELKQRKRDRYFDEDDLSYLDDETVESDVPEVLLNDEEEGVVASLEAQIKEVADETGGSDFSRYDS